MCGFGLYNKILNAHEGHKESTGDGVREMRMRSLEIYGKLWELWLLFWNQWEVIGEFKQSDRILSIKKIILHAVLWTDYRNVRCKTEWTVITWHEIERLEVIRSDLNFRCIFKVKLSFFFFSFWKDSSEVWERSQGPFQGVWTKQLDRWSCHLLPKEVFFSGLCGYQEFKFQMSIRHPIRMEIDVWIRSLEDRSELEVCLWVIKIHIYLKPWYQMISSRECKCKHRSEVVTREGFRIKRRILVWVCFIISMIQ